MLLACQSGAPRLEQMGWRGAVLLALAAVSAPAPATAIKNFLMIAVDDMRPMFGKAYGYEEVLTPNMDKHFLTEGSAMQHSYVQIAVCGPSRASVLTGRRPDTTTAGVSGISPGVPGHWCWCQRSGCKPDELFMTLPSWFAEHGFVTAGNGYATAQGVYSHTRTVERVAPLTVAGGIAVGKSSTQTHAPLSMFQATVTISHMRSATIRGHGTTASTAPRGS